MYDIRNNIRSVRMISPTVVEIWCGSASYAALFLHYGCGVQEACAPHHLLDMSESQSMCHISKMRLSEP